MSRFRNKWNHDNPTSPSGKVSMTDPQYLADCDINTIMRKYAITGQISETTPVVFGDFSGVEDFISAFNRIDAARSLFAELPAEVRARFGNDVQAFYNWVLDPNNKEEAIRLGLAVPASAPDESPEALLKQIADNTKPVTTEVGKQG